MSLSRRGFLGASGVAVAALPIAQAHAATPVFRHGVASGDPMPDRVILWTRVTPSDAAVPGSGVGPDVAVRWEMSTDPQLSNVVRSGTVTASARGDHTVKVDATGLAPATTYHYRFVVAGQHSPVGRTRTAPADATDVANVRFGVASCANWEAGYFGAYRHLAARTDLDAVVHLGDYLYEYKRGGYPGKFGTVRPHDPANEIVSLQDYRIRHGQYKTDPDLQAAHRNCAWICTWDDHESSNDAWAGGAENHDPATEGDWRARKAASEQAYYEWMPVRVAAGGDGRHLYRRLRFGSLLELSMLDLRTYRTHEPSRLSGRQVDAPDATITGAAQMKWLTNGLVSAPTTWKIVGNPVMISPLVQPILNPETTRALTAMLGVPADGIPLNPDQWDGYPADRKRLLTALRENRVANTVFITGDIHSSWACDVPVDPANYPGAGTVATELVVSSVTSVNLDDMAKVPEHTAGRAAEAAVIAANPHVRFLDIDAHGFGVLDVAREAATMEYWFVDAKEDPDTGAYLGARYRVAAGAQRVAAV